MGRVSEPASWWGFFPSLCFIHLTFVEHWLCASHWASWWAIIFLKECSYLDRRQNKVQITTLQWGKCFLKTEILFFPKGYERPNTEFSHGGRGDSEGSWAEDLWARMKNKSVCVGTYTSVISYLKPPAPARETNCVTHNRVPLGLWFQFSLGRTEGTFPSAILYYSWIQPFLQSS